MTRTYDWQLHLSIRNAITGRSLALTRNTMIMVVFPNIYLTYNLKHHRRYMLFHVGFL